MPKYTKGYWTVTKSGKSVHSDDLITITPICTLEISPQHVTEEEYKANAALIASAPKLLKTLEDIGGFLEILPKLRAIDKSKFDEFINIDSVNKLQADAQSVIKQAGGKVDKMSNGGTVKKLKGRPKKSATKKRKRFDSNI